MRKQDWLFPYAYRKVGFVLLVILSLCFVTLQLKPVQAYMDEGRYLHAYDDVLVNIFIIGTIAGLIFVAFSRERQEDEMIQKLRLQALQWSIYVNYFLLAVCSLLFYFLDFVNVLIVNMFTILLVFIIVFRWTVYRIGKDPVA
ncbi:hypothetical protein HWI92_04530 [Dyadobacter sandarakinus]|uniref:Uncharacterized protein n=2 Tax=Dyadobacter sandarakinus TaxID=2747268 RepID=A0ABX7I356_9BACT|nr:hypothetical protein HWI92_04530 [Dyadobacter sandarakinus]